MKIFSLKRRTIEEDNGVESGGLPFLDFTSTTFGGREKFSAQFLKGSNPLDMADRLEEMASHFEDLVPPDADTEELKQQSQRLREEADAIRRGGINIDELPF